MKKNETVNENMHSRVHGAGLLCLIFAANTSSEEAKKHFTASGKAFMEMAKMILILSEIHDAESEGPPGTEPAVEEVKSIAPVVEPKKEKKDAPVVEKLPAVQEYEILPPNCEYSKIGFFDVHNGASDETWNTTEYNVEYMKSWSKHGYWVIKRRDDSSIVYVENAGITRLVLYTGETQSMVYDSKNVPKKVPRIECDNYSFVLKKPNIYSKESAGTFYWKVVSYDENNWIVIANGDPNDVKRTFSRVNFYLKVRRGDTFTVYE